MKTITTTELKNLVETGNWDHKQEVEYIDSWREPRLEGEDRKYNFGLGTLNSTLGDITVTHFEGYSYYSDERDTFVANSEGLSEPWKIEGIQVIDEDGEPAHISDFYNLFEDHFPSIDYSSVENSI